MRLIILAATMIVCSCSRTPHQMQSSIQNTGRLTILEYVLTEPRYSNAVAQAERDLPHDQWSDKPWRQNNSREQRELAVATKMLENVEIQFKMMNVTQLVKSLKVFPYLGSLTNSISGVEYYVYRNGNQMIINEIKARPKSELQVLPILSDDKLEVFEGAQGAGDTLADVIKHRILNQ